MVQFIENSSWEQYFQMSETPYAFKVRGLDVDGKDWSPLFSSLMLSWMSLYRVDQKRIEIHRTRGTDPLEANHEKSKLAVTLSFTPISRRSPGKRLSTAGLLRFPFAFLSQRLPPHLRDCTKCLSDTSVIAEVTEVDSVTMTRTDANPTDLFFDSESIRA